MLPKRSWKAISSCVSGVRRLRRTMVKTGFAIIALLEVGAERNM
jgi:hypothetical protein